MKSEEIYVINIINKLHRNTSNYRQIWRPDKRMRWLVLCSVGGVNEQNSIVKKCLCR